MKRFKIVLPFALLCALTVPVLAQVPRQMSYQGVLTDPSGNPMSDGNHVLTVKLYDASNTVVFTETHNVPTSRGVFNVMLGSVTPIPASVTFNAPYTLGVAVDGGAELTPRTPLASAPYALNAATADLARGLAPGATGVVTSLNGASGDINLVGGGGTTINRTGNTITISSTGGSGGSGIAGVQNSDGSLTITEPNGPVANISVTDGGIVTSKLANGAVTPAKINSSGASNGQVLTYNGSTLVWATPSSGLTLPYSGSSASNSNLFAISGTGTGRVGSFISNNTAPVASALYGEAHATTSSLLVAGVEGRSINGFGVIGSGGGASVGVYGSVVVGASAGAFSAGSGVSGFSDNGHGVSGTTYKNGAAGVNGSAIGTGTGVQGTSNNGKAGYFEISGGPTNTNNAVEVVTNGVGAGVYALSGPTTGSTSGIIGEANSTSNGIGALGGVSGVLGRVTPTSPGGYSAGVRGINNGTSGTGIGVIGYQGGSGWGVYGETPNGFGVYGLTTNTSAASSGVRGETFSPNGIGVEAKYSGAGVGVALEVDNGAIRVAGVNKSAFVHTATAANKLSANGTDITNPLCDGDPNAILIVTQKLNPSGIVYNNSPIGVYYNTVRSKWEIFNENNVAIPVNAQFNVLVIKQ